MHKTRYEGDRKDLLKLIPHRVSSVLDIGCGEGGLGRLLRERNSSVKLFALEVNEKAASEAARFYDTVEICDIQNGSLPFSTEYFDCIVCGDVLEHLYNPWETLSILKNHMKLDSLLIVSLPNIRYYRVLRELILKGNWTYKPSGILDWSHIRFFTLKEMKKMFDGAGYVIEKTIPVIGGSKDVKKLNKLLFYKLNDFIAKQYIFVLKCK